MNNIKYLNDKVEELIKENQELKADNQKYLKLISKLGDKKSYYKKYANMYECITFILLAILFGIIIVEVLI